MTRVILKDWDRAGRCWALDTASGTARPCESGVSRGFLHAFHEHDGTAAVPRARVAAVYAQGGRLWFQVDGSRWEAGSVEYRHRLAEGGTSRFTLLDHGEPAVDIVYLGPTADPVNMLDISFDELDWELQDLFYFMAKNGGKPSWRANSLARWGEGFT